MSAKDDDFILLLLLLSKQLLLTAAVLSNAKLKHFLSYIELKRRDHHIPRCALVDACHSSFQRLHHSKNDQSFITFTGLDYNSFEHLLHKCFTHYIINIHRTLLGSLFSLQMIFGAPHSVLCLFLKFSLRLLFKVLMEENSAKICIPSAEEITDYQELVRSNFPALYGHGV
jgi:hypothetical protein